MSLRRIAFPKPRRTAKVRKPIARKKRPARVRKTSLAGLHRKLWDRFRAYVKERDGNVCFTCDKGGLESFSWHAGHFISARKASTRYDPTNVHSQCAYCNKWLKGNAAEYAHRFLGKYGRDKFDALMASSRKTHEWKHYELSALIAALEKGGADYECLYAEKYGLVVRNNSLSAENGQAPIPDAARAVALGIEPGKES